MLAKWSLVDGVKLTGCLLRLREGGRNQSWLKDGETGRGVLAGGNWYAKSITVRVRHELGGGKSKGGRTATELLGTTAAQVGGGTMVGKAKPALAMEEGEETYRCGNRASRLTKGLGGSDSWQQEERGAGPRDVPGRLCEGTWGGGDQYRGRFEETKKLRKFVGPGGRG